MCPLNSNSYFIPFSTIARALHEIQPLERFLSTQSHIVESRDHPLLHISAFSSSCLTEALRLLIIVSPFPLPSAFSPLLLSSV